MPVKKSILQKDNSTTIIKEEYLRGIEFAALVLSKPEYYNENDIAEELSISVQTVRRDAEKLRALGIEIRSVKKKYVILNKIDDDTLNRLILIYMALNRNDRIKNLRLIRQRYRERTLLIFVRILKAINEKEIIRISYGESHRDYVSKEVTPFSLTRTGREIYLLAFEDDDIERSRMYRLEKIRNIHFCRRRSRISEFPDISDMFRYSWGTFTGGEEQDVVLRFSKDVGDDFKGKFYIETQDITEYTDYYKMEMKVRLSYELISWIMGWGSKAEVLKPEKLKKAVLEKAKEIVNLYK